MEKLESLDKFTEVLLMISVSDGRIFKNVRISSRLEFRIARFHFESCDQACFLIDFDSHVYEEKRKVKYKKRTLNIDPVKKRAYKRLMTFFLKKKNSCMELYVGKGGKISFFRWRLRE